ncbi:hypothetical protein [Streptomyces luteireticuli]|uniref:hypothetical protein n=1 Tax=Streptomyces luteireticuli TaxID=173858 RepID=UPI0035575158
MLNSALRQRLEAALEALLGDRALAGRPLAEQLMAVVLLAKMPAGVSKLRLQAGEAGRWLGVSKSLVDHKVLPGMRASGSVVTEVVMELTEEGRRQVTGLEWELLPLTAALGVPGHPLVLAKRDLAVLLRLCERVFAPGWEPVDAPVTPPGLLGLRRGRGAAAERLALLRLVLRARSDGRVRLAGGAVRKDVSRAAATVARLLDCPLDEATVLVESLDAQGLVVVDGAGQGAGKCRLKVPAVAAAYGRQAVPSLSVAPEPEAEEPARRHDQVLEVGCPSCGRAGVSDFPLEGDGWIQESFDVLGDTADEAASGALRDHDAAQAPRPTTDMPSDLCKDADGASVTAGSGGAQLHAPHAPLVALGGSAELSSGFSGEADRDSRRQPGRTHLRETGTGPVGEARPERGAGGPLRGEQPSLSAPGDEPAAGQDAAAQVLSAWAQGRTPQRSWAPLPKGMERLLAPVLPWWERIERASARRLVKAAVKRELAFLRGVVGPKAAEKALTERLRRRVADQVHPVADPVGWLLGKALPRRAGCYAQLCDDGVRMDTGADCPSCALLVADHQARRYRVTGAVAQRMQGAAPEEVRVQAEAELRAEVHRDAEQAEVHRARAAAEQTARKEAWAQAQAEQEAVERRQQELPCRECGRPEAAGLCPVCREHEAMEQAVAQAVDLIVALQTNPNAPQADAVSALERLTEAEVRRAVATEQAKLKTEGASEDMVALGARLTAELVRDYARRSAMACLRQSEQADAEAEMAYAAKQRCAHRYGSRTEAREAAEHAADQARDRTARHLLNSRLHSLRAARGEMHIAQQRPAVGWAERCRELAARPLPGEPVRLPGQGSVTVQEASA